MFTGIVQSLGRLLHSDAVAGGRRFAIGASFAAGLAPGESVAVNGVCLTVTQLLPDGFTADVSAATLECTTLGTWAAGRALNLERALALGDRLDGHLVSGHVDGVGQLVRRAPEGASVRMRFALPEPLRRYVAVKGSLAVDGVSLTVNAVDGAHCEVNLVPFTLEHTALGGLAVGADVNLEVDLVARYVERLLAPAAAAQP